MITSITITISIVTLPALLKVHHFFLISSLWIILFEEIVQKIPLTDKDSHFFNFFDNFAKIKFEHFITPNTQVHKQIYCTNGIA